MSDETEAPDPNPLANVDTRYTGTPDEAIAAAEADDERRANVIDGSTLQREAPIMRGGAGGGNQRGRKKPPKFLANYCPDCGAKQAGDVHVCQECGSGQVVSARSKKRGRKPMNPDDKKELLPTARAPAAAQNLIVEIHGTPMLRALQSNAVIQYAEALKKELDSGSYNGGGRSDDNSC